MSPNRDHGPERTTTIIVNARQKEWAEKEITFEQVVQCAFESPPYGDNTIFTVTYNRGHGDKPQGTMVDGDSVKVKEGMIFNVTATDKS